MKKTVLLLVLLFLAGFAVIHDAKSQSPLLNCEFAVASTVCINQEVLVTYVGGASPSASYLWAFDGAVILSGSGQGPYTIKWETTGLKTITLHIEWEAQTCEWSKDVHVVPSPEVFHMTGGGIYVPGGPGVPVGLSGSQANTIYKLRKNGVYTGASVVGNGQPITFGPQTQAGSYTSVARVDGSECLKEMEGEALVTILEVPFQHICMVSFDTLTNKNMVIWNKIEAYHISHFNIFRETYVNNQFEKIAEVPYQNFSTFVDTGSYPLVKSDRYRLSVVDSSGAESEKCPPHKTIHLNISPGIYGFNLIWNHYEGYDYHTYRIYRKFGTDPFEVIAEVASNVDSYTDFYLQTGLVTYYIEALRLEPCEPWLKQDGYVSSISNYASAAPLGIEDKLSGDFILMPNPASDVVRISFASKPDKEISIQVCTLQGSVVMEIKSTLTVTEINVTDLQPGIYMVRVTGDNFKTIRKMVKI